MALKDEHCKPGVSMLESGAITRLLGEIPEWRVSEDGKWLTCRFAFADFTAALAFANRIGPVANAEDHHPDLEIGYGYVNCKLQTHDAGGLTRSDFILAAKIGALGTDA